MLKSTAYSISSNFTSIQSVNSHIPIPKSTSPSSPSCYRPISLLSLVSKLLEKHIFLWMYNFCCQNNILSDSQFSFRPGFSTESPLISTTHLWHQTIDSSSSICAVFFDLSKAFDSIPHSPLLDSLSSLHLLPILLHWFLSYLSNYSQQVVVNGVISDSTLVTSGVPQGSILGPLLFILYINDISKLTLSSSTKLILYADDILLSPPISSSSDFTAITLPLTSTLSMIGTNHIS